MSDGERKEMSGRIFVWGHRGSPEKAVENTTESFLTAFEDGADGVELDVQLTLDNQLIVFHDYDLKRMAGLDQRISELTWIELQTVELRAGDLPTGRVPLFDDVLDALPSDAVINVELKGGSTDPDGLEMATAEVIRRHRAHDRIIMSSFNPARLRRMRQIEPGLRLAYIHSKSLSEFPYTTLVKVAGRIDGLHPHHTVMDADYIGKARSLSRFINAWPIEDLETLEKVRDLGADAVTTNHPGDVRGWVD